MPHALIVDDQRSNISVLGMLLEQEGITYSWATSPALIGEALNAATPDIVFLDLEFPDSDGLTLLPSLRSQLSGVPIVAYTVHTSEIDHARRAGFDGFLGKPLNALDFPRQISHLLSGEPVWVA